MDLTSLAQTLLKSGASVLGGALGGPAGAALAPAIIGALADALGLGKDATPQAVDAAIKADPAAAAEAVKRVEAEQTPAILTELQARLADVQDAREMQTHIVDTGSGIAWSPTIVSAIVLVGFCVVSYLAFKATPGSAERDVVMFLLGAWLSLATAAVNFWLGSSSSSKDKDATISLMTRAAPVISAKGKR